MNTALHYECISEELKQLILTVNRAPFFKDFRLFGGTALALQLGHRVSVDADFISSESIDGNAVALQLHHLFPDRLKNVSIGDLGVFATVGELKLDFLSWNQAFIRPAVIMDDIRLMHPEEIIAHKIFAIQNRGEKKDYIDLACMLEASSLKEMIGYYREKYNGSNGVQLIRYLLSFSDIDFQPMPAMMGNYTWDQLKARLVHAVKEWSAC